MRYLTTLLIALTTLLPMGCEHLTTEQLGAILDGAERAAILYLEYEARGDERAALLAREEMDHHLALLDRLNELRRARGQAEVPLPKDVEVALTNSGGDE